MTQRERIALEVKADAGDPKAAARLKLQADFEAVKAEAASKPPKKAKGRSGEQGAVEQPKFTDEQLASERAAKRAGVGQPSYTSLVAHMERFGPEGVLESALHLSEDHYDKLVIKVKKMKYDRKAHKWLTA